jgi:hypothetical protein
MSADVQFFAILIGIPVVAYWVLALLPGRAGMPLSVVAIAVAAYAYWINVTDEPTPNSFDLGPRLRALVAMAALAGPLMALAFHLFGRRSWRWRMACFAAGFPLGFGLMDVAERL